MTLVSNIIRELSVTIGPRFSGSEGEHRAAEYIAGQFRELGLQPELQQFDFVGWRPESTARVRMTAPEQREFESAPVVYSAPAPGIEGRVKRYGAKVLIAGLYEMPTFEVLDDQDHSVAHLVVNPGGGAIPLINPKPLYRFPQLVIAQADADHIDRLLDEGAEVKVALDFDSSLDLEAYSYNVIARYRNDPASTRHLVICAHYDTQLDTPGAYDNASGVAGMFGVLERLLEEQPAINVTFVAIAGEEVGMFGSPYFVNDLAERGLLDEVTHCVCLDQISGGDFFWLWCTDPELRETALDAIAGADVARLGEVRVDDNKPGADHWAFHERGIPACLLMWWRQADYHLPSDTFEKVDYERIAVSVDAATRLVLALGAPDR